MGFESVNKDANRLIESFIKWFNCLRNPQLTYRRIVYSDLTDEQKIQSAFQLWLATTSVNIVILAPVFSLVGIEWSNVGFYLPVFLYWLTVLMLPAVFIHIALRWYKLRSKLSDTLLIYTVAVYSYSPFLIFIAEPWSVKLIELYAEVKGGESSFFNTLTTMSSRYNDLYNTSLIFQAYQVLFTLFSFFIVCYCLMNFQRMIVDFYQLEKSKVMLAMGFALGGLCLIPNRIALYFYYFIIYAEL